ncbi:morphogenic membrane protein MmpA [Streptomyces sp. enrichment culture]
MPTHRASKPVATAARPVERAVTTALVLGTLAGLAWIAGMIWTLVRWPI